MSSGGEPAPGGASARRSFVTFGIGLVLLGLAAWALASQEGVLRQAWASARSAPVGLLIGAALLPLANYAIISVSFWILMRREGRVSLPEMFGVIGAAWLLNFAPLRPGLVGRVAYHKLVNGIPVHRAIWVTITGIAAGGCAVATLLLLVAALRGVAPGIAWGAAIASPLAVSAVVSCVMWRLARPTWVYPATYGLRYLDVLLWAARYAVLFAIIGAPTTLAGAVVFASVCQATLLLPLIGNGLGVREWAIALTAGAFPAELLTTTGRPRESGLAADLLNRATELLVAVPVGLISTAYIAGRIRRARQAAPN